MGDKAFEKAPEAGQTTILQAQVMSQADNTTFKQLQDSKGSSDALPKITIGNSEAAAKVFDPNYPLTAQLPFLDRKNISTTFEGQSTEMFAREPKYGKFHLNLNNPGLTESISEREPPIPAADRMKFIHRKVSINLNDGSYASLFGGAGKFYDTKHSVDTWSPSKEAGTPAKAEYKFASPQSITLGDSARGQISLQATAISITDGRFPTNKFEFPGVDASHRIELEDPGYRQVSIGTAKDGTITAFTQNSANGVIYPGTENGKFLTKLPKLQLLSMMAAGQGQINQAKNLTDLRRFHGSLNSDVTSGDTFKQMSKLEELELTGGKISKFDFLQNKPAMRKIELNSVPITGDQLANLDGMNKLETLNLWNSKVDDTGLAHVSNHPTLKSLKLGLAEISDDGMKEIGKLKGLNTLDLCHTNVTDVGIGQLADFHDLRSLDLSSTKISDQSLKIIGQMHSLRQLRLAETKITDAGLAHLNDLKGLVDLNLGDVPVTDKGLTEIVKLDGVVKLTMDPSKLTNEGIKQIAAMKNLKSLVLYGNNYPNEQINANGLKQLMKLKPELAISSAI